MVIFLILIFIPALVTVVDFVGFLVKGERTVSSTLMRVIEICALVILPWIYVSLDRQNNCCGESAAFSPQHQFTILVLVIVCLVAYFYSSYRIALSSPVLEIVINSLLLIMIVLNIFIAIQTDSLFYASVGNLPIILLAILALVKNQRMFLEQSENVQHGPKNWPERVAWSILNLRPILKFPIFFIFCLPLLVVLTAVLMLVGQKPDSLIRAFTDTYKHGFSQWDYKCDNVECGGHYLCSVAANGHTKVVKPQRWGVRNGHHIICNRQLLISNAFEDLLQEKLPFLHRPIRQQYNKVGNFIHRYYGIFNIKLVADVIYILMKPLEWLFLLTLYTFDRKPENRIAKQYTSTVHRQKIEQGLKLETTQNH